MVEGLTVCLLSKWKRALGLHRSRASVAIGLLRSSSSIGATHSLYARALMGRSDGASQAQGCVYYRCAAPMEPACARVFFHYRVAPEVQDGKPSKKRGKSESAGINRHRTGDARALHERSSAPSWPRVMRERTVRPSRSVDRGKRRPAIELRNHRSGMPTSWT